MSKSLTGALIFLNFKLRDQVVLACTHHMNITLTESETDLLQSAKLILINLTTIFKFENKLKKLVLSHKVN